jgi:hypothetical protein
MEKEDFRILKAVSQNTIQYQTETTIANGAFRAEDERRRPTADASTTDACWRSGVEPDLSAARAADKPTAVTIVVR